MDRPYAERREEPVSVIRVDERGKFFSTTAANRAGEVVEAEKGIGGNQGFAIRAADQRWNGFDRIFHYDLTTHGISNFSKTPINQSPWMRSFADIKK